MTAGKVYLVGAGPGSPDLISLRGYRVLRTADAVLVDYLVPRSVFAELGILLAGKTIEWLADKEPRWSQKQINAWLTFQARQGRSVVRLKGGDPFVFGQADEETGHLAQCRIPWEVIPGPSSFTAALTSAGFPLTRRRHGRSFCVATARVAGGSVVDRFPRTDSLVILMGVGELDQLVATLLADGWAADTPAAVVERGTLPWERRVESRLSRLAPDAGDAGVSSPACIIVGDAAIRVGACQNRPTILFTGLDPTNFRTLGNLLHWPALEVVADERARRRLRRVFSSGLVGRYGSVVFADRLAVASFFEELHQQGHDARMLAGIRIVAVGRGAAERLGDQGIRPDFLFESPVAKRTPGPGSPFAGESVLVVEGTHRSRRLDESLVALGARVRHVVLNGVLPNGQLGRILPEHDVIYFVSPSGAQAYFSVYGRAAFRKEVWCLGSDTRHALAEYGISASVVAVEEQMETAVLASA